MDRHSPNTETVDVPENYTRARPPTLNQAVCACQCACSCADCKCTSASERESTISESSDGGGGGGGGERAVTHHELIARLHRLGLMDSVQGGSLNPTSSPPMPYQTYSIPSITDFIADIDAAEASMNEYIHRNPTDRAASPFYDALNRHLLFLHAAQNLDDLGEATAFRPHTPGAESMVANASDGETSMLSSMMSSMHIDAPGAKPGFAFTLGDLIRPLELTEPRQGKHRHDLCVRGVLCSSLLRNRALPPRGTGMPWDSYDSDRDVEEVNARS